MDNYMKIKDIMEEYIKLMDKLIDFEQEKLETIKEKNTELLDKFLKEEQVYLLQLRGLDQKRETIQKELNLEGLTYRQIIDKTESSIRSELEKSYNVLSEKTNQFKELLNTIKTYIDIKLHTIDAFKEKFGAEPSQNVQNGIYDKIANQQSSSNNHTSKFKSTKV